MQLKRLEKQATQNPNDAYAQYQFLSELAQDYPQAVIAHVSNPAQQNIPLDPATAVLYLRILQQSNQVNHLNLDLILSRLQLAGTRNGTAESLMQFSEELKEHKHNKKEQVQALLQFLTGNNVPHMAAAAGSMGSGAGMIMGGAASRGGLLMSNNNNTIMDPSRPLQVQLIPSASDTKANLRGAVIGLVAKAALMLVAFSAIGALMDERGLGRGMGLNSNSKHVQEAEQDGRKVKFEDVKGVAEAKAELEEIVLYLKDPSRFTRLGGRLPRGLLLTGPPGTGKTLLAKAIAGEADVPFFYASGSQFEEVYVGLGAKRIRELFEAAKKKAPAIIFIDEIDAVGGTRKLKDQSALKMTLNELLVQLDGFDENNGIIVIGATNFMESLDTALLRPGRFDKHVSVPLPDVGGRKEILEMYCKKTKLSKDVDINVLARGTTGFSGADLYNLINQAALKASCCVAWLHPGCKSNTVVVSLTSLISMQASVDGLNALTMEVLEYAKDKILMGAERKSAVITPETARCTAYHEAGYVTYEQSSYQCFIRLKGRVIR